jgi:transposase InsO family protein
LIHETLRSLSKAKWFTKLDVIAAFHKIRIKKGDEWKTAFRTRYGLFEWLVTPFGLTGAPATFQRYINRTLQEYLDEFCSAYIDDVLIYSDGSLSDHRRKVRKVLQRLQEAGLQVDIDKCDFEVKSVKYLGFIVEAGKGIRVDPEKIRAVEQWERPRTVKGVRGFVGFANYYREFVPNFSSIAMPLTALTKKGVPYVWSDQCDEAFKQLKTLLISAPILAQWDPDKKTVVETDSSGYAIGGALSQYNDEGILRPVAFFSKKNNSAECNYPIHDKELLAVIRCLEQWDAELRSVPSFEVWTDHKNLEYFYKKRQLSERQVRWAEVLARYNFKLTYRPGKEAVVPDALSRREQDMPAGKFDERLAGRCFQLLRAQGGRVSVHRAQVKTLLATAAEYESDPLSGQTKTKITAGFVRTGDQDGEHDDQADKSDPPENPFADSPLKDLWDQGLEANNRYWLIRQLVRDGERQLPPQWGLPISIAECSVDEGKRLCWRGRIWVPLFEPLRTQVIQETHDSALSGHPGRDLTKLLISRRFTWPGLSQDVRKFLRNCDVCGRTTVWREKRRGLLKPLPIPERIWSEISIDFITGLPLSGPDQADAIMVITDRLSKSVIFEAMASTTAEAVAERLLSSFVRHHGLPSAIVSDRGPQFVGHVWKRICELLKITRRLSTAYHPETDGATERANQVVEHYLRCYTTHLQDNWASLLPAAMLAINNRNATSTGISPFFLTHGYDVDLLGLAGRREELRTTGNSPVARGEAFVAKLKEAVEVAQAAMATAQERQEESANRARQVAEQFRVGDKVWLRLGNVKTDRPAKKLDWRNAKYTVTELIGSHACRLDTPPGIHNVFHVVLLKRAGDDPLPSQVQDDTQPPAIVPEDSPDGEEEWQVEEILDAKRTRGATRVLVKWTGHARPTWEPLTAFLENEALDRYEAAHGKITDDAAGRGGG